MIDEGKAPLVIDCLNCENGCNQGPATKVLGQSPDETEYWVKKRAKQLRKMYLEENENDAEKSKKSIETIVSRYWHSDYYERKYVNRWENVNIQYPTKNEIENIYQKMHKFRKEDILNCSSCGYNSCEGMAIAIHNGLNRPENCHHYLKKQTDINLAEAESSREKVQAVLHTSQDGFIEIDLDETIVYANESMQRILKKKDIIGKSVLDFIDNKYKNNLDKEINSRKKGQHSIYEMEFVQSDGNKICCLVSASPMYDFKTRTITGSFAMVSDISKLKETERKLRVANENLEQKVLHRTAKLNEAMEELKQQKEEILTQKDALAASEQKIHHILEMLPNSVLIIDEYGVVTFWNNTIEKMTGVPASKMIGKGNYEYAVPFYGEARPILIDLVRVDDDTLKEKYVNVIKEGTTLKAETFVPNLQGEERYLIGNATAIYDKKGEYIGAIEVIHDITEIKANEQKIEAQRTELVEQSVKMSEILEELKVRNEIIEQINDELSQLSIVASETDNAVIIMDADGKIEWVNNAFNKIHGYTLGELISQKGDSIFTASSYEHIQEAFSTVVKSKTSYTYTSIEYNKNNQKIYTQTTLSPVIDTDNNITNIVAVNSDITKIKETENILRKQQEEIRNQRDELEESSKKIYQIIESLPDASFVINSNGEVEFWNNAIAKLTGIKAKDIIGKGNFEYSIPLYGERRPILIDYTKERNSNNENYKFVKLDKDIIQAEAYATHLPNGGKYLMGTATAIYDKDENYSGAIEIIHDVTKQKEYILKIESQRKDILASIKYAKRIQEAVLPPISFMNELITDNFILFKPRNIISGDFYWATISDNKLVIAIADCTGHGVPGALMSMLGISMLNEIITNNKIYKTNQILDLLKEQVIKSLRQDENEESRDGMDISLVVYDIEHEILEFSGAHNPLVFIRDNEIKTIKGDKMPIGAQHNSYKPFNSVSLAVKKDDIFYMFSDGYYDQLNPDYKKFMKKEFLKILLENHKHSFADQKIILENKLNLWKGNNSQTDDIVVMGFSFNHFL